MSLLDVLWDNIGYALVFLFTFVDLGTSLALSSMMAHDGRLSLIGVLAAGMATVAVRMWFRQRRLIWFRNLRARAVITLRGLIWVLAVSCLGFIFAHWFSPDTRLRLSLTLLILLVFGTVWARQQRTTTPKRYRTVLGWVARAWRSRRWLAPVLALMLFAPLFSVAFHQAPRLLGADFNRRGLNTQGQNLVWVDRDYRGLRATLHGGRALMTIASHDEPADVYLLNVGLSHEGAATRLRSLHNLTDTAAVEEVGLTVQGSFAAWRIQVGDKTTSIEIADLRGQLPLRGAGWTLLTKAQNAITNLQETGQIRGIARVTLKPETPAESVQLSFDRDTLFLDLDQRALTFDLRNHQLSGGPFATAMVHEVALPGNLTTWAVDRVRAIPWIGSDGMQWIKGVAFNAKTHIEDLEQEVIGTDVDTRVKEELGDVVEFLPVAKAGTIPGWPPAPIEPLLSDPLPGEGTWTSLANDAFVSKSPGTPSPFLFTFIRIDPKRPYSQVSITLWDPRQVALNMVAGTVEPKSTTGELGTGLIPRDPEVLTRLVGAFNGAFQSMHGAFGMMVDDTVLLPPKPYAATVATLRDGSVGFGTWPDSAEIPLEISSYRQNMTPLIVGSQKNPYHRYWWGGVPEGWTEETRTVRSGLCLTREHFVGYFYGLIIDPDQLAESMKLAGCTYGMHLDMNGGHAGFEFYKIAPRGKLAPPKRALDPVWEATGEVPHTQGFEFMSRLMVRKMPLQNFPRYIKRDSRDYFYLTLRSLLPDVRLEPLVEGRPGDGVWRAVDAEDNGWPHALAATTLAVGEDERHASVVQLLKVDPKVIKETSRDEGGKSPILLQFVPDSAVARDRSETGAELWWQDGAFGLTPKAPEGSTLLAQARTTRALSSVGAACIAPDNMLVLAEIIEQRAHAKDVLALALRHAGCKQVAYLDLDQRPIPASRKVSGAPAAGQSVAFVRHEFAGTRRLFVDTPIVLPSVWAIPQRKSVKYVPKPRPGNGRESSALLSD